MGGMEGMDAWDDPPLMSSAPFIPECLVWVHLFREEITRACEQCVFL